MPTSTVTAVRQRVLWLVLPLTLVLAVPALAQTAPGMGQAPPAREFDRSTLKSFAQASVKLQGIQQEYGARLRNVQDQDTAMKLQEEANVAMLSAVEGCGLDAQTYNAIANQMNVSPDLRERVETMIEKERVRQQGKK
jgi:hypothetical protein